MPDDALIQDLVARLSRAVDAEHGGLSGAPKFPQWNVFWLLWRGAIRFNNNAAKQAVITTLTNVCQGGIYDHLGGGFSRYSVDEFWLVPHFEKMLYDNALLIDLLTEVWRETQDPLFATRIAETVAWLEREMIADGGGFAASLDADSEGEEGKFYVWTAAEILDVLGTEDAAVFGKIYGVTAEGNFEGHTILNRLDSLAMLSTDNEARLSEMRCKLFARRAPRVRPGWDDKVLADWNGLMIAALSRAAVVFGKPEWLAMPERAFAFITDTMRNGSDRLWHSHRAGKNTAPATASDYANMIHASLRLYQATLKPAYLEHARSWTGVLDTHYWDAASGGYFTAADDTTDVIIRLKSASDDAVPSANTIQLSNLFALAALTGGTAYDTRAETLLNAFSGGIANGPIGHCGLLAASMDAGALMQIVAVDGGGEAFATAINRVSVPGAIEIRVAAAHTAALAGPLAAKLGMSAGATAYLCRGNACDAPLTEPDAMIARLYLMRSSSRLTI